MSSRDLTITNRARWRLEWAFYMMVEKSVGILSPEQAGRLGSFLGMIAGRVLPRRRKTVSRNLRIAFGNEMSRGEVDELAKLVFRRTGANLLSSLCIGGLSSERMKSVVRIENPELAESVMTPDKGAIILLAHMGNWEALAYVFTLLLPEGHKAGTIYRFLNNPYMDEHIKSVRRRAGLELFEKRSSPLAMAAFVRSGGALGILSDQRAEAAGEIVPFFGRLTSCTPMPAIISRRLGVPVIGLSMRTEKPGRWVIKLHLLKEAPTTLACMRLLEEMIRESPADVFWLQDRWRVSRSSSLHLGGRPPSEETLKFCTKPRRVLVWCDQACLPKKLSPDLPDIAWECSVPKREISLRLPDWLPHDVIVHQRSCESVSTKAICDELVRIDQSCRQPLDVVLLNPQQHSAIEACRQLGLAMLVETHP